MPIFDLDKRLEKALALNFEVMNIFATRLFKLQ